LGEENPNWEGNYKVRYWQSEWKAIIFDYLDKILELGFDGVMLDIINAYFYWSEEEEEVSEEFAAMEMINFIYEIYTHAVNKTGNKEFMVFPQNAVEIIDYDREGKLINNIVGLSIENLFFDADNTQTNKKERNYQLEYLEQYKEAGKLILVTDYIHPNKSRIKAFYSKAEENGFLPYAADRSGVLGSVITITGIQPQN
jgi:cysteinyl-tRNA synthetase